MMSDIPASQRVQINPDCIPVLHRALPTIAPALPSIPAIEYTVITHAPSHTSAQWDATVGGISLTLTIPPEAEPTDWIYLSVEGILFDQPYSNGGSFGPIGNTTVLPLGEISYWPTEINLTYTFYLIRNGVNGPVVTYNLITPPTPPQGVLSTTGATNTVSISSAQEVWTWLNAQTASNLPDLWVSINGAISTLTPAQYMGSAGIAWFASHGISLAAGAGIATYTNTGSTATEIQIWIKQADLNHASPAFTVPTTDPSQSGTSNATFQVIHNLGQSFFGWAAYLTAA